MSITENLMRIGRFTSSGVWQLMTNGRTAGTTGKPFETYVKQKAREKKLFRSITNDASSKPTSWGKYLEKRAFSKLDIEYSLTSDVTTEHPKIPNFAGSTDGLKFDVERTVFDIKCPFTLTAFCDMVECTTDEMLLKEFPEYFYQLIANSMIHNTKWCELIVYVPYLSELSDIRIGVKYEGNSKEIQWIEYAENYELPYIHPHSNYKDLNFLRFEAKQEYKDALTERLLLANELIKTL
jgi:hypothetical protein